MCQIFVVSKIVEKKNESKSQQLLKRGWTVKGCVKDRWEKEWKQITTAEWDFHLLYSLCQRSLRKRMKANHNPFFDSVGAPTSCVKDRWEKEWKQITTTWAHRKEIHLLCQRSLRKRMKANHNCFSSSPVLCSVVSKIVEKKNESKSQHTIQGKSNVEVVSKIVEKKNESKSQPCWWWCFLLSSCVKDRWEKEWKQITTFVVGESISIRLCQRSLRKRMKANHNVSDIQCKNTSVVSKIVEKKNESKSQQSCPDYKTKISCVKDRWEKEWKQITTPLKISEDMGLLCQRSLRKRMKANHNISIFFSRFQ